MTRPVDNAMLAADPQGIAALRRDATARDPEAIREVARQFESLFAQMMIRNMRAAAEALTDEQSHELGMYTDMFDQQLALEITEGRGLGLADVLMRQLSGLPGAASAAGASAPAASATAGTFAPDAPARGAVGSGTHADRTAFLKQLWPEAEAAGRRLGVAPEAIVAQAALETGWGRSLPQSADGTSSNNYFGIKAGAGMRGVTASTLEFVDGIAVRENARFRAYDDAAAGVADYASMIERLPRYAAARNTGGDVAAFARALAAGGYATDPAYATKLTAVAADVAELAQAAGLKSGAARPIREPAGPGSTSEVSA